MQSTLRDTDQARQIWPPYNLIAGQVRTALVAQFTALAGAVADNPAAVDQDAAACQPAGGVAAARCAAVLQPGGAALPLVSMNGSWNSTLPDAHFGLGNYTRVADNSNVHAELKILGYQLGLAPPALPAYIGISKPCCLLCAAVMQVYGVGRRGTSQSAWDWTLPDFLLNDAGRLAAFIGTTMITHNNQNVGTLWQVYQHASYTQEVLSTIRSIGTVTA